MTRYASKALHLRFLPLLRGYLDLDNHSDEDDHDHDHDHEERYVPPDDLWCVSVTAKLSKIVHVDEGVHVTCAQACGAPAQTREINSQMFCGPSRPSITSYWCFHSVLLCFNATGFHVGQVDLSLARKPINYHYYYGIGRAIADLTLGIMSDRDAQAQSNAEKFFQRSIVAMFSTTPVPVNRVPLEKAMLAESGNGKGKEKVKKQCMCLLDVLAPKILSTVQPDMPDESQMTLERARTYLDNGILPFSACELDKIRRLFEVDG